MPMMYNRILFSLFIFLLHLLPRSILCDLPYSKNALSPIINDPNVCYSWYVVWVPDVDRIPLEINPGEYEVRIWIVNTLLLSPAEQNGTALTPSQTSATLTTLYYNTGELPTINLFSVNSTSTASFNSTNSYWVIEWGSYSGISTPGWFPIEIDGRGIVTMGCDVEISRFSLFIKKYNPASLIEKTGDDTTLPSTSWSLYRDVCSPNVMIAMINSNVVPSLFLFTQSAFINSQNLVSLSGDFLNTQIIQILPLYSNLVALTSDGKIYVVKIGETQQSTQSLGISTTFTPTQIQSTSSCDMLSYTPSISISPSTYPYATTTQPSPSPYNNYLAAWNNLQISDSIFLSLDGGYSFSQINLPESSRYIVQEVEILQSYPIYLILVQDTLNDNLYSTLLYNFKTLSWSQGISIFNGNQIINHVETSFSGSGIVFLWGNALFMSPDGGQTANMVLLKGANNIFGFNDNEEIVDFVTSMGQFSLLTNLGRVFFGIEDIPYAVEVTVTNVTQLDPSISKLQFDPFGNLFALSIQERIPYISITPIDISPAFLNTCPQISLDLNSSSTIYLDLRESITFSPSLIVNDFNVYNTYRSISVSLSDPTLLSISLTSEQLSFPAPSFYNLPENSISYSTTITLGQNNLTQYSSFSDQLTFGQGEASLRIGPKPLPIVSSNNNNNNTTLNTFCPDLSISYSSVVRVQVGCPPGRTLIVEPPSSDNIPSSCKQYQPVNGENARVKVPKKSSAGAVFSTIAISYDFALLGCPMRHFYANTFSPTLILADTNEDGTFNEIEQIPVDFILWDINDRTDFTYSETLKKVHCMSASATTKNYKKITLPDNTIELEWTPVNYVPCWSGDGKYTNEPYPILNSTSNSIIFQEEGLFIFKVRVISPYSFCPLEATFAVEVFGAPLAPLYSGLIAICMAILVATFLAVNYRYFMQTRKLHDQ